MHLCDDENADWLFQEKTKSSLTIHNSVNEFFFEETTSLDFRRSRQDFLYFVFLSSWCEPFARPDMTYRLSFRYFLQRPSKLYISQQCLVGFRDRNTVRRHYKHFVRSLAVHVLLVENSTEYIRASVLILPTRLVNIVRDIWNKINIESLPHLLGNKFKELSSPRPSHE